MNDMKHSPSWKRQYNQEVRRRMYTLILNLREQASSSLGTEFSFVGYSPRQMLEWAQELNETRTSQLPPCFNTWVQTLKGMVSYLYSQPVRFGGLGE